MGGLGLGGMVQLNVKFLSKEVLSSSMYVFCNLDNYSVIHGFLV